MSSYEKKVKELLKVNGLDDSYRIVFRVEDADGNGPYTNPKTGVSGAFGNRTDPTYIERAADPYMYGCPDHRPSPNQDGIGWVSDSEHRFGFGDLRQLRKWFKPKERKALDSVGCGVYVYKVKPGKHLIEGESQIVFKKRYAERIGKL